MKTHTIIIIAILFFIFAIIAIYAINDNLILSSIIEYPNSFSYRNFDGMHFKFNRGGQILTQRAGQNAASLKIIIMGKYDRKSFNTSLDKTWTLSVINETRIKQIWNESLERKINVSYNAITVSFQKNTSELNSKIDFIFNPHYPAKIKATIKNIMPIPITDFSFHFSTIMPKSTIINYAAYTLDTDAIGMPIKLSSTQIENQGTARLGAYELRFEDIFESGSILKYVYIGTDNLYSTKEKIFDLEVTDSDSILSANESFIFDPFQTAALSPADGTGSWINIQNVYTSNDVRATAAVKGKYMWIKNFSITNTLPVTATVVGIEVDVEGNICGTACYT